MKKADLAKAIAAYSFRNTSTIESLHAGVAPVSSSGDFSDVFVVDANGNKIPWNNVSRISQEEMRELMKTAVNRIYDVLTHDGDAEFEADVLNYALGFTRGWEDPQGSGLESKKQG